MTTASLMAANLETQILAYQQQIANRPDGQRFPTVQEINMQCKLINCYMRLHKPLVTVTKSTRTQAPATAATISPQPLQSLHEVPVHTPPPQRTTTKMTQQEFENHKHLLDRIKDTRSNVNMKLAGRYVNAWWLEYTLFQYCLPLHQRNFIDDPAQVIAQIDHAETQARIAAYLAEQKK